MMNPDLVCKIVVRTSSGKQFRGSGYPITPNRIITAAHVVADAACKEGTIRDITLTFGAQAKTLDTPVSLEWCGTEAGIDVAVLRCDLPAALQSTHELLTEPPKTPMKWFAQGYTEFGKEKRPGGKDAYDGTLSKFSAGDSTVALGCREGLITSKQWLGGSGSVAFDIKTSRTALAVITEYQSGKKLDQLVAVPICYLLKSEVTRAGFCHAIQFDSYQRREAYRSKVKNIVASKLNALHADNTEAFDRVAQEINALMKRGKLRINLELRPGALAEKIATGMISHIAVDDAVSCLVHIMDALRHEEAGKVADIIDHILPLNYAPSVMQRLQDQLASNQFGLVENEVATRALAEIIMAGYDRHPAKFVLSTDSNSGVRGKTALDYYDGPESGPSVLPAVCNFLCDLVALLDTLWDIPYRPRSRDTASAQSEVELQRMMDHYVVQLRGVLTGASEVYRGRTVYCVLQLPPGGTPERDFCKQVITEGRRRIIDKAPELERQLIFVELSQTPTDIREFKIEAYVKARVMWTQPGRKR